MPDIDTVLQILAWFMVVIGLLGAVLPALPGLLLLLAGLVMASWLEGFAYVGAGALIGIGALAALGYGVDFAAGVLGARRFGASKRAMVGAGLGAVVGLFFGLPGILLGPLVGAVVGELSMQRSLSEAGRAGIGTAIGVAVGVVAKLAIAFTMVGSYLILRFF